MLSIHKSFRSIKKTSFVHISRYFFELELHRRKRNLLCIFGSIFHFENRFLKIIRILNVNIIFNLGGTTIIVCVYFGQMFFN